ncbi:hypothetical protein [Paraburkholderia caballeronis]|uniref:hypothetical protein n=1 Tax=Paraburkholderia caballeronis TaxID=416943 RepID=UPI00115FE081|nr:hypothetical protein [Paraburkholderia caballeronis]
MKPRSQAAATATAQMLDERLLRLKSARGDAPIQNPRLAEVSELLHRICEAKTLDTARWMAGDALVYLRNYISFDLERNRD